MTAVVDTFPRLRSKKFIVAPCICAVLYLLGLTMCTQVRHDRGIMKYTLSSGYLYCLSILQSHDMHLCLSVSFTDLFSGIGSAIDIDFGT